VRKPLYKDFNLIKQFIEDHDFKFAEKLLTEIEHRLCGKFDNALYIKYKSLLPENAVKRDEPIYFDSRLSEYDSRKIIPGISIVSCCMNRNDNLKKALKTWLKLPVDEVIIVDWSSNTPVDETINEFDDDRIKIIRVEKESKWILTYGFNVGLRFASYSKIFKFDADIEVSADFLTLNQFNHNQFVRGYWKSALDQGEESQVYVNGSFGCYKKDLIEIGFYNELIRTYGWDDSDIYERLSSQCGLATKYLDFTSVVHLDQEEEERIKNQDIVSDKFLGVIPATEFNNLRNKFIGRTSDYWDVNRLQDYSIKRVESNLWKSARISEDIHIQSHIIEDANIYSSLQFMWSHTSYLFKNVKLIENTAHLFFNEYATKINFNITLLMIGQEKEPHGLKLFTINDTSYEDYIASCLEQANISNITVFALSVGEKYNHKTIGIHGKTVEMVMMPQDLLVSVLGYRLNNGFEQIKSEPNKLLSPNIFMKTFQSYSKKYVYVDAQHGLGNRLRAIGSAASIAVKTGRELIIVWQPDHHCECHFSDLFDYNGVVIEHSFIEMAKQSMSVYNYMEIEDGSAKDELIDINENKDLYLRAAYTFNSTHSDWESENKFIQQLTPTKEITNLVEQFDMSNCIAAHVRMEAGAGLDNNTYDSIENWSQEGHDQIHYWREKSHYSHFIKRIDQLLADDKEKKIFLATDIPETYKVFENYYREQLIYLKRDVYDRSKEQIIFGLADAILLSKAQQLLGSTWSSFTELAMRLSENYTSIEMSGKDF